jgi:uncharacterized membrane protein HdeD (DUF308 family)
VLVSGVLTAIATIFLLSQTPHRGEVTSLLIIPAGAAFLLREPAWASRP